MHGARPLRSTRRLANLQAGRSGLLPWYRITNQAAGQPVMVSIYDEIGAFGVPAGEFLADLKGIDGDIEMHINSPGGDIFDGITIYNQLKARQGQIHVIVDGLAASAASFISQAASPGRLEMAPRSKMMIHNGFGMAFGDATDMRKTADLLDELTQDIASIYAERSGRPVDYWLGMMGAETWYSDAQAVEMGLADYVTGQEPAESAWDLSVFSQWAGSVSNADGGHGSMRGSHTHSHQAYGAQGSDESHSHEHNHLNDFSHAHVHNAASAQFQNADNGYVKRAGKWVFDPDNDGDDDSTPAGDKDHDYWSADGKQLKSIPPDPDGKQGKPLAPGARWTPYHVSNADKYKQADRDQMAKSGEAMPDGAYPIRDAEDLDNAIHAVGSGGADHDAIRMHIIKRAKALGLSSQIPDSWGADGSLEAGNMIDTELLSAAFAGALKGGLT